MSSVYSDSEEYRKMVIEMMHSIDCPLLTNDPPIISANRYHHLGIAVSSIPASISFYSLLGFKPFSFDDVPTPDQFTRGSIVRLKSPNGLEIHLIQADGLLDENKNILMDYPTHKPPGHTHASWSVCSVPSVRAFLESNGIAISGTRNTLAVFARDLDRTTLEFERNDGGDDAPSSFVPEMIGDGKPLDHVGIRIRAPYDDILEWYAKNLGFVHLVRKYEPNPDPLKNNPPWITRTKSHCDINFIINCNTESNENALFADGRIFPGILYVAYDISLSATEAVQLLTGAGVDAVLDTDLESQEWGNFQRDSVFVDKSNPTVLVRDPQGNITRFVSKLI